MAMLGKTIGKSLRPATLFIAACALSTAWAGEYPRSKMVLRAFVNQQACPATGQHRLPCPGYHIDHIVALCAGGADSVDNLQWLARDVHKEKTKGDLKVCRGLRQKLKTDGN